MIAMDIGSIASVPGTSGGPVISDGFCSEKGDQGITPTVWSLDEAGWPVDEEGWPPDGQLVPQADGQLNFVKGNGKGKGKGCSKCGASGHYARECPKPPKGKNKGQRQSRRKAMLQLREEWAHRYRMSHCSKGQRKRKGGELWWKIWLAADMASPKLVDPRCYQIVMFA